MVTPIVNIVFVDLPHYFNILLNIIEIVVIIFLVVYIKREIDGDWF